MEMRLIALAVFACSTSTAPQIDRKVASISGCEFPENFGAVVNDGLDDRAAIQSALDSGAPCVELGVGQYDVARRPGTGATNIPSLKLVGNVSLKGQGELSVISMLGSGVRQGATAPSDWHLLSVTGSASVRNLKLTGEHRFNTDEQTHLLQVNGPSNGVVVDKVIFNLPPIGNTTGGDCIRLVGTPTQHVVNTSITNNTGVECDRSFIGFQRGTYGVTINNNTTHLVGDQVIDFEPTGGANFNCNPIISDVTVDSNSFSRGVTAQGGWAITIVGDGCAIAEGITVRNSFLDGGVYIADAGLVTLDKLEITGVANLPAVQGLKRLRELRIITSVVNRPASGVSGNAVKLSGQNGFNPEKLVVVNSVINQNSPGNAVLLEDVFSATFVDTTIVYTGPQRDAAVTSRGIATVVSTVSLVDSSVFGSVVHFAQMMGLTDGTSPVLVRSIVEGL